MPINRIINVHIDGIAPNGCGEAIYNNHAIQVINRPVLVWGAFPGEDVEAEIFKHDGGRWYGVPNKILKSDLAREIPKDIVYLSSSPWQGLGLDDELRFKMEIIKNVFAKHERISSLLSKMTATDIVHGENIYGYRNKMEYHIFEDDGQYGQEGHILATIFGRKEKKRVPIPTNCLVVPGLHEFVEDCVKALDSTFTVKRNLKTLIIRSVDNVGAALFVKDMNLANQIGDAMQALAPTSDAEKLFKDTYKNYLSIYYSNPKSPASTPDKLIYQPANSTLIATLDGMQFEFGLLSFFQVNIKMAEKLLHYLSSKVADIIYHEYVCGVLGEKGEKQLDESTIDLNDSKIAHKPEVKKIKILDYYSGVGTIGLYCLAHLKHDQRFGGNILQNISLQLVEESVEASEYAKINALKFRLEALTDIRCGDSADALEFILGSDIIIVDPPRAGLNHKLSKKIVADGPNFLIYQSCNIESQVRDLELLNAAYSVEEISFYNFFPRTPHIESLIIMKRKPIFE